MQRPLRMQRQVTIMAEDYIKINGIEQYIEAIEVSYENIDRIMYELLNDVKIFKAQRIYEKNHMNDDVIGKKRKIDKI